MENLTYPHSTPPSTGLFSQLITRISLTSATSSVPAGAVFVLFVCCATRLFTGLRYSLYASRHDAKVQETTTLPYWIPYVGHTFSFLARMQDFIGDVMVHLRQGAFALNLANFKLHIIAAPSLTKQVLSVHAPVDMREIGLKFVENVFGEPGNLRKIDIELVYGPVHRAWFHLNRDPFVSQAVKVTVERVERLTGKLIDFRRGSIGHDDSRITLWEKSSRTTIVSDGEATAEFYKLVRDFVGSLALPSLMGERYCGNFPNTLTDIWTLDKQVHILFAGAPRWLSMLVPSLSAAIAARERLSKSVAEFEDALCDRMDGKEPTERWGDLNDVSNVIRERVKALRSINAPAASYGPSDTATMWAMMVNANQLIFWMLWYIYSSPNGELLADIRKETADLVLPRAPKETGGTERNDTALRIDMDGLMTQCPLLQSTFLETMRLKASSPSFKKINSDFTITESAEDAARMGKKSGPQSYKLPKGGFFCVPNGAHQTDPRYWKDPKRFDPRRFMSSKGGDQDGKTEVEDSEHQGRKGKNGPVDYGTMTVWGGGPSRCKGQKFAEREVFLFVASIVTLWEVEPLGRWVHPVTGPSAGTPPPMTEVMVKLRRRSLTLKDKE